MRGQHSLLPRRQQQQQHTSSRRPTPPPAWPAPPHSKYTHIVDSGQRDERGSKGLGRCSGCMSANNSSIDSPSSAGDDPSLSLFTMICMIDSSHCKLDGLEKVKLTRRVKDRRDIVCTINALRRQQQQHGQSSSINNSNSTNSIRRSPALDSYRQRAFENPGRSVLFPLCQQHHSLCMIDAPDHEPDTLERVKDRPCQYTSPFRLHPVLTPLARVRSIPISSIREWRVFREYASRTSNNSKTNSPCSPASNLYLHRRFEACLETSGTSNNLPRRRSPAFDPYLHRRFERGAHEHTLLASFRPIPTS